MQAKQAIEDERLSKIEPTLAQMVESLGRISNRDPPKGNSSDDPKPEYKKSVRTDMPKFDGSNVQG